MDFLSLEMQRKPGFQRASGSFPRVCPYLKGDSTQVPPIQVKTNSIVGQYGGVPNPMPIVGHAHAILLRLDHSRRPPLPKWIAKALGAMREFDPFHMFAIELGDRGKRRLKPDGLLIP
jgi:hypothetical protein